MNVGGSFVRDVLAVSLIGAALIILTFPALGQEQPSSDSAQSRRQEALEEARKVKEEAHRAFETDMHEAVAVKNRAIADLEKDLARAKAGAAFKRDMDKAATVKNRAIADLKKDLARAKARVAGSSPEDMDKALTEAESIKKEAIARFDKALDEASEIKQKATSRFESALQAPRQEAESLLRDAESELRKGETKPLSLARGSEPAKKLGEKKALPPNTISLTKSGTTAGKDLEQITSLPERIKQSSLSDEAIALQEVPKRPDTLFRLGDPFFGSGPISTGFEIPTGAVWQPQFFPFGSYSTAVQTFDDGNQEINEWVNSLAIFANLNLTPTERILLGFNILADDDGNFTGYEWSPNKGSLDAVNGTVQTAFLEGRFDSLFPGLKSDTGNWASFNFAVGRQPVNYQSGILINDTFDSVGITRVSLQNILGSVSTTLTALHGFNHLNRGNNERDNSALLFGLFSTLNYPDNKVEADMVVVTDTSTNPHSTLNLAVSSYQQFWGLVNATFSLNQSFALNGTSPVSKTGTLFFAQLNGQAPYTIDNVYLNLFGGINDFLSAARSPTAGGPLGQTGLLFAATGLGRFGPALPSDGQDMFGGSIGYQRYLGSIRRQIIFEFGGVTRDSAVAFSSQFEQAIGRHFLLTLNAFVTRADNRSRTVGYGARSVFTILY